MSAEMSSRDYVMVNLNVLQMHKFTFSFPERQIKLTPENPSIIIGRASKTSSRGYDPAPDNAWYNSAVMSRHHAELTADFSQKKLKVKDLGSLHGTFLNTNTLVHKEGPQIIGQEDFLRFGVSVWRGNEEFPPVILCVTYEFHTQDISENTGNTTTTGTFQVPDGSDDESGGCSDSDDEANNLCQTDIERAAKFAAPSCSKLDIVDLTPDARKPEFMNKAIHKTQTDPKVIDLSSTSGTTTPINKGSPSVNTDKIKSSDANIMTKAGPSPPSSGDVNTSGSISGDSDEIPSPTGGFSLDADDNGLDDAEIDPGQDLSEDMSDVFDESKDDEDEDELEDGESMDIVDLGSEDNLDLGSREAEYEPSDDYPEVEDLVNPQDSPVVLSPLPRRERAPRSTSSDRIERRLNNDDSSVSCIALPKPEHLSKRAVPRPDAASYLPSHTSPSLLQPAPSMVETLGAKTGKVDYFEAREVNKMILSAQRAAMPRQISSVYALCNEESSADRSHSSCAFGPAAYITTNSRPSSKQQVSADNKAITDASRPSACTASAVSPPSAKVAEGSSTTMSTETPSGVAAVSLRNPTSSSSRTYVGISDIVNSPQQLPNILKRKADDISDTTQQEEQWAAKETSPQVMKDIMDTPLEPVRPICTPPLSPALSSESSPERPCDMSKPSASLAQAIPTPSKSIPATPEPARPSKKAKLLRIAERVGYAALGGVTAGAMIVGTLIYTAPTFN